MPIGFASNIEGKLGASFALTLIFSVTIAPFSHAAKLATVNALGRHSQSPATCYRFRYFFAVMYSSRSRRTHLGPPSSSQASRWAWVSGRHDTGAGLGGAVGRPAPSRLPPLALAISAG